jgi:hypothetical protein
MGPDNNPEAGVCIAGENYVVLKTGHEISGDASNEYSLLTHFDSSNLYGTWDVAPNATAPRVISSNANGGHFVQVSLVYHNGYVFMFGTGLYRNSNIYLAKIPSNADEPFPKNNLWTAKEPARYFVGFKIGGGTGGDQPEPSWSESESSAEPVVQDDPNVLVNGVPTPVCSTDGTDCNSALCNPGRLAAARPSATFRCNTKPNLVFGS